MATTKQTALKPKRNLRDPTNSWTSNKKQKPNCPNQQRKIDIYNPKKVIMRTQKFEFRQILDVNIA